MENSEKILSLEELTRDAISWLEKHIGENGNPRNIPFIAAIHDDHTQLAHVHALLLIERHGREKPIDVSVINEFRGYISQKAQETARTRLAAREQNYLSQLQEQSIEGLAMQEGLEASVASARMRDDGIAAVSGSGGGGESGGGENLAESGEASFGTSATCLECLIGTIHKRLNSRVYACDMCGYAMREGVVIRKGRRREAEVGRAY